jgi:uncharacterized membrane protein YdjX (TVP38/TMEM64 family)
MKHVLWLVVGVAAAIVLSKLLLEDVLGVDLSGLIHTWIAEAGPGSALAVIGLLAADIFLPIPSSLVMILSGAAFGVVEGAGVALVGSIGGEWLGFELVRRYGRRVSSRVAGEEELARLSRVFARHGAAAVIVTRAVPVLMETLSVVAGLSGMPRRTFLLTSLAGTAPIVLIYAYAGAVSRDTGSLVPAVVILLAVSACGWIWYRARLDSKA